MSWEFILGTSATILSALIGWMYGLWRALVNRVDSLEKQQKELMTEQEVRQLLNDKLIPLADDIKEVRNNLDRILDHIIDNSKK